MALVMVNDIARFTFLWLVELLFFTCVGVTLFAGLTEFSSITTALINLFTNAMGTFDFSIYDALDNPWVG
jgi:hypothetical protein